MVDKKVLHDAYDIMEEKLKDDARTIKEIKNLGHEIVEKLKVIKLEKKELRPRGVAWDKINYDNQQKLIGLYNLEERYKAQYDIIMYVLGKEDSIISNIYKQFIKDKYSIDDKFFINKED